MVGNNGGKHWVRIKAPKGPIPIEDLSRLSEQIDVIIEDPQRRRSRYRLSDINLKFR